MTILRSFGRYAIADSRDANYRVRAAKSSRVRRYWRDDAGWLDQGETSSCVGHAWAHWALNAPIIQSIDPIGVYRFAQFLDEWEGEQYEGTSVRAGAKVMATMGYIAEYRWATKLSQMIYCLLEAGPVVVGTNWYEGMMETDQGGFVSLTGDVVGGHAWLVNGVDTKAGKFRGKNSYGREWGDDGHLWIAFDDMERLIDEDGEVCLPIEKRAM